LSFDCRIRRRCKDGVYASHSTATDEDTAKDSLKKVSAMSEDLKMRAVHDPVFDFIFG
jgi:hypothetical protein